MQTRRRWRVGVLLAAGLVGLVAVPRARAAESKDEVVEAEMLRDLDLLRETNMAQQDELLRHMRVLERLRLLESLGFLEGSPTQGPATKEEK